MENEEYVSISFSASQITAEYMNSKGEKMSIIGFPPKSKYHGYVWHYRTDWLRDSKFDENYKYIGVKASYVFYLSKNEKQDEEWKTIDRVELSAEIMKKEMLAGKKKK